MKRLFLFLSEVFDQQGVFRVSLIALSVFFVGFDIWQLFTSANEVLALVSIMCLWVTGAGHMGLLNFAGQTYYLVYLVPAFLLTFASVPGIEGLGMRKEDFSLSALATVMSALVPLLGATVICGVIGIKRLICSLFEKP